MNIKFILSVLTFAGMIFCFSCNNSGTKGNSGKKDSSNLSQESKTTIHLKDFTGIYKATAEKGCNFIITINKEKDNYLYKITDEGAEYSGKLVIEDQEDKVYFSFDGKIEDNAPKTVGGQIIQEALMIQNYGNSMNEYHYFKKCDVKYLEFKKQ